MWIRINLLPHNECRQHTWISLLKGVPFREDYPLILLNISIYLCSSLKNACRSHF